MNLSLFTFECDLVVIWLIPPPPFAAWFPSVKLFAKLFGPPESFTIFSKGMHSMSGSLSSLTCCVPFAFGTGDLIFFSNFSALFTLYSLKNEGRALLLSPNLPEPMGEFRAFPALLFEPEKDLPVDWTLIEFCDLLLWDTTFEEAYLECWDIGIGASGELSVKKVS